jgi:hypothetical protein
MNHYVRGAVSGLGVINVCAGLIDLAAIMIRRDGARGREGVGVRPADVGADS